MRISLLSLLSISMVYGLERPSTSDRELSRRPVANIDLSKVQPLKAEERPIGTDEQEKAIVVDPAETSALEPSQPWLGVMGESASVTLLEHLGISNGLVLRYVDERSPAFEAGLRTHDILQTVNGVEVSSQEGLKAEIYHYQPTDQLTLQVISKGVLKAVPITLQPRPMLSEQVSQIEPKSGQREGLLKRFLDLEKRSSDAPAERSKSSFGRIFDNLLKEVAPKNPFNLDFQATSSISMMDNDGSVEIQVINGEKNVVVRDHKGMVEFEGPWNSEEEKTQATEGIRDRIENINFNYKNQKLRLNSQEIR